MRIGVISDTHIADEYAKLPKQIVDDFKNTDMILHAGDLIDISMLDKLRDLCKNVYAVWGNMDSLAAKQTLPEKQVIPVGEHRIGLTHGFGSPDKLIKVTKEIFKDDDVDIIVFGHAHYPVNEVRDGILFFNPGSAMEKIFSKFNSYGILEVNAKIKGQIVRL